MAWRVERFLVRGEIDNRIRDRITGRLWFLGRADPVELELYGNARRDLAGKRLEFSNPKPQPGVPENFSTQQIGVVSEFTGSRKVRVPDIELDDDPARGQYRASVSWHGGNALSLEWFSLASGRVIMQSTEFTLTIDPDSCWEMSAEEEKLQLLANARAIELFNREIEFLAANEESSDKPVAPESPAEFKSPFEDIFEDDERTFEFGSDTGDDVLKNCSDEIDRREDVEEECFDEEMSEELPLARDVADVDPVASPLAEKARALTIRVLTEVEKNHWAPSAPCMHPVIDLVSSIAKAGGKIATAIGFTARPNSIETSVEALAALKQACGFLNSAAIAADFCRDTNVVPQPWLRTVQTELDSLREDTDVAIEDLVDRLNRGFD
jgi:hypothetical protein